MAPKIIKTRSKNVTQNPDTFCTTCCVDFGSRPPSKTSKNARRVVKFNTFVFFGSGQIFDLFCLNFDSIFDLVCLHFGSISASFFLLAFLTYFVSILAPFLGHLGSLGAPIGPFFGDLGPQEPPRHAKVPPRPSQDLNFEHFWCPSPPQDLNFEYFWSPKGQFLLPTKVTKHENRTTPKQNTCIVQRFSRQSQARWRFGAQAPLDRGISGVYPPLSYPRKGGLCISV